MVLMNVLVMVLTTMVVLVLMGVVLSPYVGCSGSINLQEHQWQHLEPDTMTSHCCKSVGGSMYTNVLVHKYANTLVHKYKITHIPEIHNGKIIITCYIILYCLHWTLHIGSGKYIQIILPPPQALTEAEIYTLSSFVCLSARL